ncbi:MAG: 4-hydroxy-3-methylbut-2-enyl diphosphate reductase [Synergistaceae bacterium]|nr:4-hydroxy-3-methylbut-2-enyl diphosphate reductase [Synergistaceae bacterium]
MRVITAEPTGLCFGVRRAITTLEEELKKFSRVYALGSPIHNPQEIERLSEMGLVVVDSPRDVPHGAISFVRAHGVSPETLRILSERSSRMVDGTCPFVKTAQERAKTLSQEGYTVIILGDATHPEVKGIMGYVSGEAHVLASAEDISGEFVGKRCGLLSQTTQRVETFSSLVSAFVSVSPEIKVYNTICRATLERQQSVCRLAEEADGIIVLGGRNSANTRKLAEIAFSSGVPALWIEHAGELDGRWPENKGTIGIAAGGSTPDWLIKELIQKLKTM